MRLDAIVYRAFTLRGGARAKASRAQGGVKALGSSAFLNRVEAILGRNPKPAKRGPKTGQKLRALSL